MGAKEELKRIRETARKVNSKAVEPTVNINEKLKEERTSRLNNKKKRVNHVARRIATKLYKEGFKVQVVCATTSSSVYLKLDYGVAGTIRISDHLQHKKYNFRYNVVPDFNKPILVDGKVTRYFYNFEQVDELVKTIKDLKRQMQEKQDYGFLMSQNKNKIDVVFSEKSKLISNLSDVGLYINHNKAGV